MNDPAIENEVIRRWQAQMSLRQIAAELRISRYLVKRIILDHQAGRAHGAPHPDLPTPPESRGSILDQHVPFIQELLTRWPSLTALHQLWPRLMFSGACSTPPSGLVSCGGPPARRRSPRGLRP
jgi:hypothetical protein